MSPVGATTTLAAAVGAGTCTMTGAAVAGAVGTTAAGSSCGFSCLVPDGSATTGCTGILYESTLFSASSVSSVRTRLIEYSGVWMYWFGTTTTSTSLLSSSVRSHSRFSLMRYVATSTGTCATTCAVLSLRASSPISRRMARAMDSTPRMLPMPVQRGQVRWLESLKEGRRRWRDISSRPKRDSRPIWMRARSCFTASRRRSSTSRWFLLDSMSMKSMTISPPMSRIRSWRAISSAASRLVLVAVVSMSEPRVARAELISMATSASV